MKKAIVYDAVLCVGNQHVDIAAKVISSLLYFSDARKIFVIAQVPSVNLLKDKLGECSRVNLLNEENVICDKIIKTIKQQFKKRTGRHERFGWYLQQFLKMSASELPELADHYLIWDSDTVLLKKIEFFDNNEKILVSPATEFHRPYFHLIDIILNFDKQVKYSFISEHLMVKKEYMKSLIKNLTTNAPTNISWMEFILNSINDKYLPHSGFSEYETYGNYIALKFKYSFSCRKLKSTRKGTMLFGKNPNRYALFSLMRFGYSYATFEIWHNNPSKLMLLIIAYISKASWEFHRITRCCSGQLKAAAKLDH